MNEYAGSCHCRNVRFEVQADLTGAGVCKCSIGSRVGSVMVSVLPSQFRLLAGDAQSDYHGESY